MKIISNIAAAFRALSLGGKAEGTTYYFDRKKGIVEFRTDPTVVVRMELFKRFINSKSWGIELTVRNNGEKDIDELLIVFNKKFSIILNRMKPDSMKIKSLEFSGDEFDTDGFLVELSIVKSQAKKQMSEAYSITVPMSSIMKELKELGKVTPIDDEKTPSHTEVGKSIFTGFEAEFIKQASIKPRITVPEGKQSQTRESLLRKLEELENQKTEITKSFMKREIDYTTFSQLMNPIVQETILIKSQMSKQDRK
ncbi:MAG: hypothetical protein ABH863_00400 [Candidatus Micrarchaeota archaeon]